MKVFFCFLLHFLVYAKVASAKDIEFLHYKNSKPIWKISAKKFKFINNKYILSDVLLEYYTKGGLIRLKTSLAILNENKSILYSDRLTKISTKNFLLTGKNLYFYLNLKRFFLREQISINFNNE